MSKNCQKLPTIFNTPEPSEELFSKIMGRIHKEQKIVSLRRRFAIFSVGLFGSIIAFIPAFHMMQKDFFESGFSDFFSLIFSDSLMIIKYWQSFMLTLLEALPAVSIILFLVVVCAFFGSLKFLLKNIKIIFRSTQTVNN